MNLTAMKCTDADTATIELTLPPTVKTRNMAYYLMVLLSCDTEEKRTMAKAYVDVANKYDWYAGDLAEAVIELTKTMTDNLDTKN